MAMGLGLTLGPVFGSFVFSIFEYSTSMLAFALIVFTVGMYGVSLIPDHLNKECVPDQPSQNDELEDLMAGLVLEKVKSSVLFDEEEIHITYGMILANRVSFSALAAYGVATMSLVFLNPILTIHLIKLGSSEEVSGYGFAVLAFSFGVGAPCMGKLC